MARKRSRTAVLDDMQKCIDVLRKEPCAGVACVYLGQLADELSECVKASLLRRLPKDKRKVFMMYVVMGAAAWADLYKGPMTMDEIRQSKAL